jgi:predicted metallopeptidase
VLEDYEEDDNLLDMASKVINENKELGFIDLDKVSFIKLKKVLKRNHILGRCVLLGDRTEFLTGKRYMIEMPEVFYQLNIDQQKIVMEHELYHIDEEMKGLVQHDIGEFNKIVDKYGLDWYDVLKEGRKKNKELQEINKKKLELEKQKKKLEKEMEKVEKKVS